LNKDDEILKKINVEKRRMYFSLTDKADFYTSKNGIIYYRNESLFKIPDTIKYKHNYQNVLAAVAVAKNLGVPNNNILDVLKSFKFEEHRLEEFLEFEGIKFINDSKATNSFATIAALESFPKKKIILILSGREKKEDFNELIKVIKNRAKFTILVGEISNILEERLKLAKIDYSIEKNFYDAVKKSINIAEKDDYVLLSPAGASFDMFKDYRHRGETFKKIVLELTREKKINEC